MNRSPSTSGPQRTPTQVNTTQVNTTQMLLREVEAIAARSLSEVSRGETVPHEKKRERNPLFERVQRDPKDLRCLNVHLLCLLDIWCNKEKEACTTPIK